MGDGIGRRALLSMALAGTAGGFIAGCSGDARPHTAAQPKTLWVSGNHTIALDAATGAQRWSRPFGAGGKPPIVAGGVCYLANRDSICAVDAASGAIGWQRPLRNNTMGSPDPMFGAGLVFTADVGPGSKTSVYALDHRTGNIRWRSSLDFQFEYMQYTSGWLAVSTFYIGSQFAVLDARSGEIRYRQPGLFLTLANHSPTDSAGISVLDGHFIMGREPGPANYTTSNVTYSFDPRTRNIVTYPSSSAVFAASKTILFTGIDSGQPLGQSLQAVNIGNGELLWSMPQPGNGISRVAPYGDIVLAVTDTGATGMSPATGKTIWSRHQWNFNASKAVYSNEISDGILLLGTGPAGGSPAPGGTISALDCRTGVIRWSSSVVSSPMDMVAAGDSLFVVAGGNTIYALDVKTGHHKWALTVDDMGSPRITAG